MARRSNSMRVRRRQSDAKWRASVANCYTTLKIITSTCSNKKKSKRKFSKAHILQETVNYISYLESMLSTFLNEKDKMIKNGSLPNTSHSILMIEQVRQEFSAKQAEIFANGMTMRKCSSSLDDLLNEAFEVDSTVSSISATKITETPEFENKSPEETETEFVENSQVLPKKLKFEPENESSDDMLPIVFSPFKDIKLDYSSDQEVGSTSAVCKLKEKPLNVANQFFRDPLKTEIKIEEKDLFETPKKQTEFSEKKAKENQPTSGSRLLIRQLPGGSSLFTPLKSPPVFDLCLSPIATPYRMQLSNYLPSSFQFSTPENEQEKTLTCHESVDLPDSVTPSSKSLKINATKNDKHGTTCRKRLDKLFTEPKSERDSSFDLGMHQIPYDDSLDFDGYFLFYKQFVEEFKHQSPNKETLDSGDLARKVSRMWSNLPAEEKSMLVAMAALEKKESHNIKLTDDLRNLDVKKVLDIDDIDDAHLFSKNAENISQVVPEMNFNQPTRYSAATATCSSSDCRATASSLSQCVVPEYNPIQSASSVDICSSPFTSTSNSLSDHYYWKSSSPFVSQTFKMDNAMDISYEIIDLPTAESLDFSTTAVSLKSECDDGQLVPIWDSI